MVRRIVRATPCVRSSAACRPVMFATSIRQPSSEYGGFSQVPMTDSGPSIMRRARAGAR